MRKAVLIFTGVIYFGLGASLAFSFIGGEVPEAPGDPCSCDTWYRTRDQCPNNPNQYEYHCSSGGEELCTITNC